MKIQSQQKLNNMLDFRENIFAGFVGETKSGKTTLMFEFAKVWKSSKPKNYLVYGFDVHGNKGDIIDVKIDIANENWREDLPKLRNSLIILDELRILHPEDKTAKEFKELCSSFQNRNNDIFYAVHNPKLILELFTYYTTQYYIFKTKKMSYMSNEGNTKVEYDITNEILYINVNDTVNKGDIFRYNDINKPKLEIDNQNKNKYYIYTK